MSHSSPAVGQTGETLTSEVEEIVEELLQVIDRYELDESRSLARVLHELQGKTSALQIKVAILGGSETSKLSVKRTLLALQQDELYLSGMNLCTHLSFGADYDCAATMNDGSVIRLPIADVKSFVEENRAAPGIKKLMIRVPNENLWKGLVLIDTPLPNRDFGGWFASVESAIQEADACLVLLGNDSDQSGKFIKFLRVQEEVLSKSFVLLEDSVTSAGTVSEDAIKLLNANEQRESIVAQSGLPPSRVAWLSRFAEKQRSSLRWIEGFETFEASMMSFGRVNAENVRVKSLLKLASDILTRARHGSTFKPGMLQRAKLRQAVKVITHLCIRTEELIIAKNFETEKIITWLSSASDSDDTFEDRRDPAAAAIRDQSEAQVSDLLSLPTTPVQSLEVSQSLPVVAPSYEPAMPDSDLAKQHISSELQIESPLSERIDATNDPLSPIRITDDASPVDSQPKVSSPRSEEVSMGSPLNLAVDTIANDLLDSNPRLIKPVEEDSRHESVAQPEESPAAGNEKDKLDMTIERPRVSPLQRDLPKIIDLRAATQFATRTSTRDIKGPFVSESSTAGTHLAGDSIKLSSARLGLSQSGTPKPIPNLSPEIPKPLTETSVVIPEEKSDELDVFTKPSTESTLPGAEAKTDVSQPEEVLSAAEPGFYLESHQAGWVNPSAVRPLRDQYEAEDASESVDMTPQGSFHPRWELGSSSQSETAEEMSTPRMSKWVVRSAGIVVVGLTWAALMFGIRQHLHSLLPAKVETVTDQESNSVHPTGPRGKDGLPAGKAVAPKDIRKPAHQTPLAQQMAASSLSSPVMPSVAGEVDLEDNSANRESRSNNGAKVMLDPSLQNAIDRWARAYQSGNISGQVAGYAPFVDNYLNARNVRPEQIRRDKEADWKRIARVNEYRVIPISATDDGNGQKAILVQKEWSGITTSGTTFSGSDIEKLVFVKIDSEWKIVDETEVRVLRSRHG